MKSSLDARKRNNGERTNAQLRTANAHSSPLHFQDRRPESAKQTQLRQDILAAIGSQSAARAQAMADISPAAALQRSRMEAIQIPLQKKSQTTGLPGKLRAGIENLSGIAMHEVRVHYGSAEPAQLNAHAFARGRDIHLAAGQEKHLPHEAWHVVQQHQGRVQPTLQMAARRSMMMSDWKTRRT